MVKWQKFYHHRIKQLLEKEGESVTLEQINRYGINLFRPFQFEITKEGLYVFYYHQFKIQHLSDKKYKIIKHVLF
ncbi:MAG TPA: hypothetical protein PLT02_06455 [Chitinophagaceae bacterium]|nr:hypothetical protein [Chitinophagaceae bacterium]